MAVLQAGAYIIPDGVPSGGEQKMQSAGVPQLQSVSDPAKDQQTTSTNVTVLASDVNKSLGLVSVAFDVETDDSFLVSASFADVVASGPDGQIKIKLVDTVSNVIITEGLYDFDTTNVALNMSLADIASGNEANASLELLADGINQDITFKNDVTAAAMNLFRSRTVTISVIVV